MTAVFFRERVCLPASPARLKTGYNLLHFRTIRIGSNRAGSVGGSWRFFCPPTGYLTAVYIDVRNRLSKRRRLQRRRLVQRTWIKWYGCDDLLDLVHEAAGRWFTTSVPQHQADPRGTEKHKETSRLESRDTRNVTQVCLSGFEESRHRNSTSSNL